VTIRQLAPRRPIGVRITVRLFGGRLKDDIRIALI
jgi:hypothetical protein